jgi:nucleolar complex protein 3
VRKTEVHDDLPSLNSDDESWDSELPEDMSDVSGDEVSNENDDDDAFSNASDDSNEEMPYETAPRKQRVEPDGPTEVQRLPIKLANGQLLKTGTKTVSTKSVAVSEESSEDEEEEEEEETERVEDVATGARFGRPAVVDVLQTKSRRQRIEMAKEQIAGICQEIMADPENSVRYIFNSPPANSLTPHV